jgi:hypothetical protein
VPLELTLAVFRRLEFVRSHIESWLPSWIEWEALCRADFFETANGNWQADVAFVQQLSQTAPTWGRLVAPGAENVAQALWARTARPKSGRSFPTVLTQQHRREAKAYPSFPIVEVPKPDRLCRGCGKQILREGRFCGDCAAVETLENFKVGAKLLSVQNTLPGVRVRNERTGAPSRIGNFQTCPLGSRGMCTRYKFNPHLPASRRRKRSALGVSEPYVSEIQAGKRVPHPRHWQALGTLVGMSPDV